MTAPSMASHKNRIGGQFVRPGERIRKDVAGRRAGAEEHGFGHHQGGGGGLDESAERPIDSLEQKGPAARRMGGLLDGRVRTPEFRSFDFHPKILSRCASQTAAGRARAGVPRVRSTAGPNARRAFAQSGPEYFSRRDQASSPNLPFHSV